MNTSWRDTAAAYAFWAVVLVVVGAIVVGLSFAGAILFPVHAPRQRPSIPAGQVYARYARAVAEHPERARKGMTYGILVQGHSGGYVCLSVYCHTWSGIVVVPGGRIEHLTSDEGDDGMAQLVSPGDLFEFPSAGPVDAPSDDGGTLAVRVLIAGAVSVP